MLPKRSWFLVKWRPKEGILGHTWILNPYSLVMAEVKKSPNAFFWMVRGYDLHEELDYLLSDLPKYREQQKLTPNVDLRIRLLLAILDQKFDDLNKQEQRLALSSLVVFFSQHLSSGVFKVKKLALIADSRVHFHNLKTKQIRYLLSAEYNIPEKLVFVTDLPMALRINAWQALKLLFRIRRRDMETEIYRMEVELGVKKPRTTTQDRKEERRQRRLEKERDLKLKKKIERDRKKLERERAAGSGPDEDTPKLPPRSRRASGPTLELGIDAEQTHEDLEREGEREREDESDDRDEGDDREGGEEEGGDRDGGDEDYEDEDYEDENEDEEDGDLDDGDSLE